VNALFALLVTIAPFLGRVLSTQQTRLVMQVSCVTGELTDQSQLIYLLVISALLVPIVTQLVSTTALLVKSVFSKVRTL